MVSHNGQCGRSLTRPVITRPRHERNRTPTPSPRATDLTTGGGTLWFLPLNPRTRLLGTRCTCRLLSRRAQCAKRFATVIKPQITLPLLKTRLRQSFKFYNSSVKYSFLLPPVQKVVKIHTKENKTLIQKKLALVYIDFAYICLFVRINEVHPEQWTSSMNEACALHQHTHCLNLA